MNNEMLTKIILEIIKLSFDVFNTQIVTINDGNLLFIKSFQIYIFLKRIVFIQYKIMKIKSNFTANIIFHNKSY